GRVEGDAPRSSRAYYRPRRRGARVGIRRGHKLQGAPCLPFQSIHSQTSGVMEFKWACFISHRVGKGALAIGIVDDFHKKLADELELQSERGVYLSESQLQPGNVLDPALANELCQSACMIVLFTGAYFSKVNPCCTREYLAMRELETKRLAKLDVSVSKK